mmetsp:Transcript_4530/g.10060  ORF Transcript_4530/g.10060 Transcript_4530/m.10060 type:complete len:244 (-) Transcript_4530:915-1646(-)
MSGDGSPFFHLCVSTTLSTSLSINCVVLVGLKECLYHEHRGVVAAGPGACCRRIPGACGCLSCEEQSVADWLGEDRRVTAEAPAHRFIRVCPKKIWLARPPRNNNPVWAGDGRKHFPQTYHNLIQDLIVRQGFDMPGVVTSYPPDQHRLAFVFTQVAKSRPPRDLARRVLEWHECEPYLVLGPDETARAVPNHNAFVANPNLHLVNHLLLLAWQRRNEGYRVGLEHPQRNCNSDDRGYQLGLR